MFIRLSLDGLKDELSWEVQNVGAWPLEDLHVSYPILGPPSHHPLIFSANCFVFALKFDIKGRDYSTTHFEVLLVLEHICL